MILYVYRASRFIGYSDFINWIINGNNLYSISIIDCRQCKEDGFYFVTDRFLSKEERIYRRELYSYRPDYLCLLGTFNARKKILAGSSDIFYRSFGKINLLWSYTESIVQELYKLGILKEKE